MFARAWSLSRHVGIGAHGGSSEPEVLSLSKSLSQTLSLSKGPKGPPAGV